MKNLLNETGSETKEMSWQRLAKGATNLLPYILVLLALTFTAQTVWQLQNDTVSRTRIIDFIQLGLCVLSLCFSSEVIVLALKKREHSV
jgi:hypothetical protein